MKHTIRRNVACDSIAKHGWSIKKTTDSSTLSPGTFVTYAFILQGFELNDICCRLIISFSFLSFSFFFRSIGSQRWLLPMRDTSLEWFWNIRLDQICTMAPGYMSHPSNTCSPDRSSGTDRKRIHQFHSLQRSPRPSVNVQFNDMLKSKIPPTKAYQLPEINI